MPQVPLAGDPPPVAGLVSFAAVLIFGYVVVNGLTSIEQILKMAAVWFVMSATIFVGVWISRND